MRLILAALLLAAPAAFAATPAAAQAAHPTVDTRVTAVIAKSLGVDPAKVKLDSKLHEDLGADDLDMVELVMALEEEFGISIPDEQMDLMHTVFDAIAIVKNKLNG